MSTRSNKPSVRLSGKYGIIIGAAAVLLSAVAINCAYTLPVSVRAFAVSYGLDPQVLFHRGMLLTVCNILLTTAVGSLILILLPAFGKL